MEEDNKKKKNNKKNKNKKKPTTTTTTKQKETDSTSKVPDDVINVSNNVDSHTQQQLANGTQPAIVQQSMDEMQMQTDAQMQKEATLEENNNQWLKEKEEILQKEAAQEETIKRLHNEKNESMLQEMSLKEKIRHLENEKDELIRKESTMEQINKRLQSENESHLQKEAGLEVTILKLEGEKDTWLQKEAVLQEKINNLMDDVAVLNLKAASLQDKIKQMEGEREDWFLRENSARESITSQKIENIKLRAQVQELEQSSKSFLLEKRQLQENISTLQLKINNLERAATSPSPSIMNQVTSQDGDRDTQIEASRALIEKLCAENSQLVEKVNELHVKLDLIGVRTEDPLAIEAVGTRSADIADNPAVSSALAVSDDDYKIEAADTTIEVSKMMMPLSSSDLSLKDVVIEDERNSEHLNDKSAFRIANTSEIEEVDENVQIPLDEHQVTETNLKGSELEENGDISLTDAPLIGAPFRLISFVARYVSGADLVK